MIRIKLDENLGNRGKEIFIKYGFTVDTVYDNIEVLANTLKDRNVCGKLWIIYKKVIREYQEE